MNFFKNKGHTTLIYNIMKVCKYRNCKKMIFVGRSDKQYCNRSCKTMEQTYRKRQKSKKDDSDKRSGNSN